MPSGNPSQGSSAGPSYLELDTSDIPPGISQSPVQSPTSTRSPTLVCSPRSLRQSTYPKPKHTPPLLRPTPTTPGNNRRYNQFDPITGGPVKIPAGPLAVHRGRRRSLPGDWLSYTHPEGLTYFVDGSRNIKVVTQAHIYDNDIRQVVTKFADSVFACAASDCLLLHPSKMELLVDYNEEDKSCSYYFVDDEDQVTFWMDELSTDQSELDFPSEVLSHDHLRTYLHKLYWQHREYFPVHNHLPDKSEQNLIATMTHGCIDVVTSPTSTVSFERSQLETMLGVMKNLKHSTGSEGQRNCIVARLWTQIYYARFINYHGEKSARLFRTQIQRPEEPSSFLLKIIFLILFDAPSSHLDTLKDLYAADEVLYSEPWRKFIEALVDDWQDLIFWTTVLLAANMSFLAIFNSRENVISESHAVTCSIVSTLFSTVSIIIGLLHVRKHRSQMRTYADEGNTYLQAAKHPYLGFRPLAIIYSLPYAFLMWAMATFISAILLYTFNSGLGRKSTFVIGAIAIGLGCTLLWAISYFWKFELGLLDGLRDLRRSLRQLSPMRLNRIANQRMYNPEATNVPIVLHWAGRFTASSAREDESPQRV